MADLTGAKAESLLAKVQAVRDDVLRLRVFFNGNDSSLPLSFASTVVQSTEKLLKVGACTVLRPRVHHPRLTLNEAAQLVEKARFAQTENGSFILRVACPIQALEVQGTLELQDDAAPFVRQVTLTVQKALMQLRNAIEADTLEDLVSGIKRSPSPLISSNLCEAIAEMHDEQVDNSLNVSFDWSALHRLPSGIAQGHIRFQRDYFARIEEVRRELRSSELAQDETFIGTVERLDGEMGPDGKRSGAIVVALLVADEGETVRAKLNLSVEDYAKAHDAHTTHGAYVKVTGTLRPGRQPRQLVDVKFFEVLAN